jgi:ribosomal protein S18 acetylase RimI-like enzyme
MIEIRKAQTEAEIEQMIGLAHAYVDWMVAELHAHYPTYDLTAFAAEHTYDDLRQKFPGEHVPPVGAMFLALNGAQPCGCVALGPLDKTICELRTMYVLPSVRGQGAGKQLALASFQAARQMGYSRMRLDTLEFMTSALGLYHGLGFKDIAPYRTIPGPISAHIHFLELALGEALPAQV